jgi:hypothetical protein
MWTIHKPEECKKFPIRSRNQGKAYKDKRKAYVEAKAALHLAVIRRRTVTQKTRMMSQ